MICPKAGVEMHSWSAWVSEWLQVDQPPYQPTSEMQLKQETNLYKTTENGSHLLLQPKVTQPNWSRT